MKIKELVGVLDCTIVPKKYQESYDNCGLILGNPESEIHRILTTLDVNEFVIEEAIANGCNMIISHHPIIFKGLKTLVWNNSVSEKVVMMAISADISIYAAHTSLDNRFYGSINEYLAKQIGLTEIKPLVMPKDYNYLNGGAGAIGVLEEPAFVIDFLCKMRQDLKLTNPIKHTSMIINKSIKTIAICTGAGFFMANEAKNKGADLFITSDLSYHNFFDEKDIILADMGHYESEKHSSIIIYNLVKERFSELEVIASKVNTNPVSYAL